MFYLIMKIEKCQNIDQAIMFCVAIKQLSISLKVINHNYRYIHPPIPHKSTATAPASPLINKPLANTTATAPAPVTATLDVDWLAPLVDVPLLAVLPVAFAVPDALVFVAVTSELPPLVFATPPLVSSAAALELTAVPVTTTASELVVLATTAVLLAAIAASAVLAIALVTMLVPASSHGWITHELARALSTYFPFVRVGV